MKREILSCIKCRSNDIDINDCGYTTFNTAWGKCNKCGNEHKFVCGIISEDEIIKRWNEHNNPKKVLKQISKDIISTENKLKSLKKEKSRIEKL